MPWQVHIPLAQHIKCRFKFGFGPQILHSTLDFKRGA
jgi:hypothetical protein